jgi:transcriptional regulator with XRE-family HTH domain
MTDSDTVQWELEQDSAKATIANNLILARRAKNGITQAQLAGLSGVSRATIAQMESGESDPRLSTLVNLAAALGTSPILLLLGELELSALVEISRSAPQEIMSPDEALDMRRLVDSGLRKKKLQAADKAARAAQGAGLSVIGAAIGAAGLLASGMAVGALFGGFLRTKNRE